MPIIEMELTLCKHFEKILQLSDQTHSSKAYLSIDLTTTGCSIRDYYEELAAI